MKTYTYDDIIKQIPKEVSNLVAKQMEIAELISIIIEEKGISQRQLAEMLSMKESRVSKILSGYANLTLKTIAKFEAVLDKKIIRIASEQIHNPRLVITRPKELGGGIFDTVITGKVPQVHTVTLFKQNNSNTLFENHSKRQPITFGFKKAGGVKLSSPKQKPMTLQIKATPTKIIG